MSKANIAILCPVHKDVHFVAAQLDNYYQFHTSSAVHFLHLSNSADPCLHDVKCHTGTPVEFVVNEHSWPTNYQCTLGALISNSLLISKSGWNDFTHVYIHTDGDLLVSGDFLRTVESSGQGFSRGSLVHNENWAHFSAAIKDERFKKLRSDLGIENEDIKFGRQEGSFFSVDVWKEIFEISMRYFDIDYLQNPTSTWPIEEVVIPTLACRLLGPDTKVSRCMVRTKAVRNFDGSAEETRNNEENVVQPEDIRVAISNAQPNECVGMKWFSRDLGHPARRYVAELIGHRAL